MNLRKDNVEKLHDMYSSAAVSILGSGKLVLSTGMDKFVTAINVIHYREKPRTQRNNT